MTETFKNFIAGAWADPAGREYFENRNPADQNDVIGLFPRSGPADMQRAIASAQRGFARWSKTPAPVRGQVLQRVAQLLVERKEPIARAMTREMGKVLAETRGDVQEGIDTAFYAATEGRRLFGRVVPSELRHKWAMSFRRPIGVTGLITPFNFPLAIPTWKMFPALLCGNAVIFKPAEDVPHSAHLLIEVLIDAGLPAEVVQLVHGQGSVVGRAMVEHPDVPVISFTGSTETGAVLGATCGRMHKRLSLEMGGKNAMIVMDDADLDLALDGVLWGAFGTTGQRCTATSRLILHEKIHDRFLTMVCDRAGKLRLGPGLEDTTDVGPLIHEEARQKVDEYVGIAKEEGASVVLGGRTPGDKRLECGWFYAADWRADGFTGPRCSPASSRGCASSRRRSSAPRCRSSRSDRWTRRSRSTMACATACRARCTRGTSTGPSGRWRTWTTASLTSTPRRSAPKPTCRSAG